MKSTKSFAVCSVLLLAVLLLGACGAPQTSGTAGTAASSSAATSSSLAQGSTAGGSSAAQAGGKPYIPIISKGFQHQFWQAVKNGAEKAAQDMNAQITFEGPESESQVDKQIEMLQAALDKKPQAICLAALDSKAVVPQLQQAKAANIPVIGFDSGVDSDIPVTTAATDNIAAAGAAADKMATLIGNSGEVALVVHDQTSRTGIDRRDGFVNRIKEKYPQIQIVDIQYGGGDQLKSTDLAKTIMQAHPNLKGFFGANEGSIIGVLNAVKEVGKEGKLTVIGYDSGKQQTAAVRSGVEAGGITQDPIGIGYKCVEAAMKAIKGETLPKTIDTGFHWYDKTNIDASDIKPLLYQ